MMSKETKKPITIRLEQQMHDRLDKAAQKTGLKKTTVIEQGLEKRLKEIEK